MTLARGGHGLVVMKMVGIVWYEIWVEKMMTMPSGVHGLVVMNNGPRLQ